MPRKSVSRKKATPVSPPRNQDFDTYRVMSLIPLFPYQVVADVGCGSGYFAIPLAKHLFDGKVYAVDILQEMLDAAKAQVERIHLTNVEFVLSKKGKLPLEDDSLDGAFAAFVVHQAENPKGLLEEMCRCLRKGGWLALLEWHKRETEDGPPVKELIDEMELHEMAKGAKFRFTARHSLSDDQYMLLMRK